MDLAEGKAWVEEEEVASGCSLASKSPFQKISLLVKYLCKVAPKKENSPSNIVPSGGSSYPSSTTYEFPLMMEELLTPDLPLQLPQLDWPTILFSPSLVDDNSLGCFDNLLIFD